MGIIVETEPGQEPSQESSHERNGQPSHELTADGSREKSSRRVSSAAKRLELSLDEQLFLSTTSYEFIGNLAEARGEAFFIDGSRYQGTWDALGMAGAGSYRMPHDVLYEGEIRDGMHHGQGTLEYPGKQRFDAVWSRGELKKWKYTFSDGLSYETNDWPYCKFPDRRFYRSKINGLNPAGRSLKTEDQPTKVLPSGCYDTGDGVFDPSTLCVTNFERPSKVIRIPTAKEREWIIEHCRKGGTEPVGYQPWFNENWSSRPPNLPYRLPMSNDSPQRWWKRVSTFKRDTSVILDEHRRSLDKTEDSSSRLRRSEGRLECICLPQLGPQPESDVEEDAYALAVGVCGGDQGSEELPTMELDAFRRIFCEEMKSGEYEGEDAEDLLMTVCVPPEGTYAMRRRRTTTKSLGSLEEEEEEEEENEEEGEEGEEEFGEESKEEGMDYWGGKGPREKSDERGQAGHEEDEADDRGEREYYFDDFLSDETFQRKFMQGDKKEVTDLPQGKKRLKKRKSGRAEKTKTGKQVGLRKQKKRPCPVVSNTEELLQRKVGDLLFSPALDAPRSPVYLVRKECDRTLCRKSRRPKYDYSKCGVSSAPTNSPAKKRTIKICKADKKIRDKLSDKKKICSPSKPFITVEGKSLEALGQFH